MYLTKLADVIRAAGLKVTEVAGWETRGRGPFDGLETIVCHHTAGPSAAADASDYPSLRLVRDGRPGLSGPLSNLGLGRSGRVYVIAAGKANHAGRVTSAKYANAYAIGIEAENNGTGEPWPTVQRTAYARLCAALVDAASSGTLVPGKRFPLTPDDVRAHREVCDPPGRKIDPAGIIMNPFREAVRRELVDVRASRDAPRPKPAGPAFRLGRVLEERSPRMRGDDVRAVQRRLMALGFKLPEWGADGVFGDEAGDAVAAAQAHFKLKRDRQVGPKTTRALGGTWVG